MKRPLFTGRKGKESFGAEGGEGMDSINARRRALPISFLE